MKQARRSRAVPPRACSGSTWAAQAGHALIGARQWIPRAQIEDPVRSLLMGLPLDLAFRTKGQLAIDIAADALADGITFDFFCGDEVYGNCTELRAFFEGRGQAYVLRVPSNFPPHPGQRQEVNLRGRRQPAVRRTPARGPVRREGLQGRPLGCVVVAGYCFPAALPADPPPPQDR
jgi:DDE superfamily endonuclease